MTLGCFNQKFEDYFFGKDAGFVKKTFGILFSFIIVLVIGLLASVLIEVVVSIISFLLGMPNVHNDIPDCRFDSSPYHGNSC
jgi:hypothetical protein